LRVLPSAPAVARVPGHGMSLVQVPGWGGTREEPTPPCWAAARRCCVARAAECSGGRPRAGAQTSCAFGATEYCCCTCPGGVARGRNRPHHAGRPRRGAALRVLPRVVAAARVPGHGVSLLPVPLRGGKRERQTSRRWVVARGCCAARAAERPGGCPCVRPQSGREVPPWRGMLTCGPWCPYPGAALFGAPRTSGRLRGACQPPRFDNAQVAPGTRARRTPR